MRHWFAEIESRDGKYVVIIREEVHTQMSAGNTRIRRMAGPSAFGPYDTHSEALKDANIFKSTGVPPSKEKFLND